MTRCLRATQRCLQQIKVVTLLVFLLLSCLYRLIVSGVCSGASTVERVSSHRTAASVVSARLDVRRARRPTLPQVARTAPTALDLELRADITFWLHGSHSPRMVSARWCDFSMYMNCSNNGVFQVRFNQ